MRLPAVGLVLSVALCGLMAPALAQDSPGTPRCRSDGDIVSASGTVQSRSLPYYVEVDLRIKNRSSQPLRIEPAKSLMVPDVGHPILPASRDQVAATLAYGSQTYAGFYGSFWFGWFGISVGVGPIDLAARAVDARMLKAAHLAPGATAGGSLYFRPSRWPARFAVSLEGLVAESGASLPPVVLWDCSLPVRPAEPPAAFFVPGTGIRTVEVTARAQAGPVSFSVSSIELARDSTTLTVEAENTAESEADLFTAIGQTHLVDPAGRTYAVRILPSDLPFRLPRRSRSRGRLVFDPLPVPDDGVSTVLVMPGILVAGSAYDLRLELRLLTGVRPASNHSSPPM